MPKIIIFLPLFILLIFIGNASDAAPHRVMLNIYPLLGYQTLDVRVGNKFTVGIINGSFSVGTGIPGFTATENIALNISGGLISYWPKGALDDGNALNLFAGNINTTDTYCNPTCAISKTQGPYMALFWQRFWMWNNGFNMSAGIGMEYLGVSSSTGSKPAYTSSSSKITIPLGIGWAF